MLNTFSNNLEEYASMGYRTLCFASSVIDSNFFDKWIKRYKEATISITNRESNLTKAAEEIESNLVLVGVSAIEDKLQDV